MSVTLTLPYLHDLYNQINSEAFGNRLPPILICIGRATRQLGCFVYPINIKGSRADHLRRCKIRISSAFNLPHESYRDTLAHEMIHLYLWLAGVNETHHGPTFRRMMRDINQRCGYHIEVSSRMGQNPAQAPARPVRSYFAILNWRDGERTITRMATTFVFTFHRAISGSPDILSVEWYASNAPWLRRFPAVRTLQFYTLPPAAYAN